MRALIWIGPAEIPGGHKVQAERTVEALANLGVDVSLGTGPEVDLDGVDLVHSILADPSWTARASERGIPVVVSTVYWSTGYVLKHRHWTPPSRRLVNRVRSAGVALRSRAQHGGAGDGADERYADLDANYRKLQRTFAAADLLLPNSEGEAEAIRQELGIVTPMHVVPNGVDPAQFSLPPAGTERSGVLYVGRIDPHKNQLGLIRALAGSGIELTLAGPDHPHHPEYARACRRAAGANVHVVGRQDQASIIDLFQHTAVHAMPSWFETTGLSSLEASLCGAAIVTTNRGYTRDYFGDMATYCDPDDHQSILDAVGQATALGGSAELRERIYDQFTWRHTAEATLEAYHSVLAFDS
jgi:glycosyltransferase involved in cell wall biosynthesis